MATLAHDLAMALDPAALMQVGGLVADDWQADLLRSSAARMLICCARQSGKSVTVAALALHTALYQPSSLILVLAPALRQSQELFRKVLDFYRAVGRPVMPDVENRLSLELNNGSRIVTLPGHEQTVRGFSGPRLLLVDEAARVPDELYYAIRPMLAVSGGRLIALSTPFGARGFFHHEWTEGGAGWSRVEIPADRCPRISPAFLEEERRALPALFFESEYMCQFVDTLDTVFGSQFIHAAIDPAVRPLFA